MSLSSNYSRTSQEVLNSKNFIQISKNKKCLQLTVRRQPGTWCYKTIPSHQHQKFCLSYFAFLSCLGARSLQSRILILWSGREGNQHIHRHTRACLDLRTQGATHTQTHTDMLSLYKIHILRALKEQR